MSDTTPLEALFCDPFDPKRSIQLNNRFWPDEDFSHIETLKAAEVLVQAKQYRSAINKLSEVNIPSFSKQNFLQILNRVKKLEQSRSYFGHLQGIVDVDDEFVSEVAYKGDQTRSSYDVKLSNQTALIDMEQRGLKIHTESYGYDMTRVSRTVRYAEKDERAEDNSKFGRLSDFHNDEYKGITTVCYLSDVTSENGPFQFIPNSHNIPRSTLLNAIHQHVCFDLGMQEPIEMSALPLEFRATPAIGNFLDAWKEELLFNRLVSLEGSRGSFVTFNGQYVIHRGGKPLSGSRLSLFLQPIGVARLKVRSLLSLLTSRLNLIGFSA